MKSTTQYSVGGDIFDVAEDRRDEFLADAGMDYEEAPEEVYTFWVYDAGGGEREVQVKASRVDEFIADAQADGCTVERQRRVQMDDGETLALGDEDLRQFVQARRTGQTMSRGLLKQTGIPEQYGRSAADREALADWFAAMYPEDEVVTQDTRGGDNFGDTVLKGAKTAYDEATMAPGSASREWMDEGAARGEYLPTAVKNANAYMGKAVQGVANLLPAATDVLGQVVGGESTAAGRYMRGSAQAGRAAIANSIDTELPQLETGSGLGNAAMNAANAFVGDTGATLVKFSIPGAAAVDISANAANTYYDAYQQALANGNDEKKAEALAAAKAGIGAFEGIILAQSAQGAGGIKGFLKRVVAVGAKMGGAAAARDVVDQGIEGAENPDLARTAKEAGKAAIEGAAFEATSRAVHEAQNRMMGRVGDFGEAKYREEQKTAREEQAKEMRKAVEESKARAQYDGRMSEEAAYQLDREIQAQIDAGTIPESARETVKRKVVESAGDNVRALDDADVREQAIFKAAADVTTPTRVESAAHERRTVEAQMKENEYWARRSDELAAAYGKEEAARKVAEEQMASARRQAAEDVAAGEREAKQTELEAAFADLTAEAKPNGKGRMAKPEPKAEMTDAQREAMVADEAMQDIVARARKATTAEERAALQAEFAARWREMFGEKKGGEKGEGEGEGEGEGRGEEKPVETDMGVEKPVGEPTGAGTEVDADAGFRAWAVDRDGKPMAFATKADEKAARELFEMQVRRGKVDPKTGKEIVQDSHETVVNDVQTTATTDNKPSKASLVKMKVENVIALPDSIEKYRELRARAGLRYGHTRNSGSGQMAAKEYERMDKDGWGDLWNAQMSWSMSDKKTRGDAPPDDLETFNKWKIEHRNLNTSQTSDSPVEAGVRVPDGKGKTKTAQTADADAVKAAAKLLGADAYNKAELEKKLAQWEANPTAANAKHREAAKVMLGKLAGNKTSEETAEAGTVEVPDGKGRMVDSLVPKPEEIRAVTDSANANVDDFTARMTKKQKAAVEKTLNQSVSAFGRTMTMRYFLEHAKNKGLKLSAEFVGDGEKPGAVAVVRLPDGKIVKLNNTQLSYAKDHLKIETNESEIATVRKQIDDAVAKKAEEGRAAFDKQRGIEITDRPFGEYELNVDDHVFKIKRNKKTGELTLVDSEGNEISTVGGERDAFESKQEMVDYLKDKARDFVDGDYDAVEHHARMIAEKKTKAYTKEIDGLKHITENDKRQFRKLAREYEDAYTELKVNGESEKSTYEEQEPGSVIDIFVKARDALERFHDQAVKYSNLKRDKSGRPILEVDDTTSMRRNDPKLRSANKVVEWAKANGRTVTDGMVTPDALREYEQVQAEKAAKLTKNWFPDMKVTTRDKFDNEKGVIEMRDTTGNTLGYFRPSTKEVALMPGANAETVAHEIMWHGSRYWATTEAAKGNTEAQKLLDAMHDVENNVSPALRTKVLRLYRASGVTNRDTLLNEFGAWDAMVNGGKALEDVLATREGQKFYAKWWTAAKDIVKGYMAKHGGNRVDLSEIDGMTTDQFKDWMAKNFAGGKTLGTIGAPTGTGKEVSTDENMWQKARRKMYDSVAAVRDVERAVEKKTGKKISTDDSVDAALALRPGLQEAVSINQKRKIVETKDMLKKYGLSSEDIGYYMAVKAAQGRDAKIDNKELAKIRDKVEQQVRREWGSDKISRDKDAFEAEVERRFAEETADFKSLNASAIDPREAASQIKEIENGSKRIEYGTVKDKLDEIQSDTLDTYIEAGLISRKEAERLRTEEPDYVPFKSEFDADGEYVGRSTNNLAAQTFKEAKGRKTAAGDIVAHILNDNAMAHMKAIENGVREKLAKLVEANPELGTVEKLGNSTEREARRGKGGDKNVVIFKREGENYVIRLNGARGAAMAAAITKANQTGAWANAGVKIPFTYKKLTIRAVTRATASMATELSPTFAVRNLLKDNIELAGNVIKDMGYIKGGEFAGRYVKNQATSAATLAKYVTTGKIDATNAVGKELQSFIENGGMIGGSKTEGYGDISKALSSEEISKEMKKGKNAVASVGKHVLKSVSYLNHMSELTSRFNAYRTQVEMGMTPKEAALWSRRTLTDFNRRGDYTGVTNVLKMFSNSTLGATAKAASGLVTTKNGLKLSAGLMAVGIARAVINEYANADKDEENIKNGTGTLKDVGEYDRKSSLWMYKNPETGKITKIGAHEGPFSMLVYAGDCAARVAMGKMTAKEMAKELGMSTAELASAFSSLGSVNFENNEDGLRAAMRSFWVSLVPSIAQPIEENRNNTDYAGRTIYVEKGKNDDTPYYQRARKSTVDWAKIASKKLNDATGGNEDVAGWIDISAEELQHLAEGYGKNVAKDVITMWQTGKAILNGDFGKLESRQVPIKRDFIKDNADSTNKFYEYKKKFERDYDTYTGTSLKTADERKKFVEERPWMKSNANELIDAIENFRKLENGKVKDGRSWRDRETPPSDEQVEKWKKRRLELQARFLKIMGYY